jgi:type I restriction enzyme M protein
MTEYTIESFNDFHETIESLGHKKAQIFRGLSDASYEFKPSICRLNFDPIKLKGIEKKLVNKFKSVALAYIENEVVPSNDLDWLALAQHHGLPTRLMDWTYNPLIALFFAVKKETNINSCVYVLWDYKHVKMNMNPFNLNEKIKLKYHIYHPSPFIKRAIAQSSIFSVHPLNNHGYNTSNICKLIIKNSCRKKLKDAVIKYGVSYKSIYPDMNGLCMYLKDYVHSCWEDSSNLKNIIRNEQLENGDFI